MPGERRTLRSNKSESSSSTNGEKARSNSQSSSSNKDKPAPTRSSSAKGKTLSAKKGAATSTAKSMSGDKPHTNGTEPIENGVNGADDVEMGDDPSKSTEKAKAVRDKDGDESMTVVVPPPKSSKSVAEAGGDQEGDTAMDVVEQSNTETPDDRIDPKAKAIQGSYSPYRYETVIIQFSNHSVWILMVDIDITANLTLLERAVVQFDPRFTLRVLRSMSSVRKHISPDVLAQVITSTYPLANPVAKTLLAAIGKEGASFENSLPTTEMDVDTDNRAHSGMFAPKAKDVSKDVLPEVDTYISILVQIHLYDTKAFDFGAKFSSNLVERIRTLNRRTLDSLSARVYFYYSLFFEQLAPLPPSPSAPLISIRQPLLAALRTSVLRKDQDTHATVSTLLLRNYLSTSHISQADLLISHTQFPSGASSNQIARYLYYLGRIRAIQLSYTEAHEHLTGATRKSPSTPSAGGFYQAATKLLIIVELLMGDIPDRAIFRQPNMERVMHPYLLLVQAVRVGDLEGFLHVVQTHNSTFRRDGTYTLILRLRQNVIKTGIRMMSLSYARISLRDICLRLGLGSEESAEYIVAKAIRDGVIEATLEHEGRFMKSKDVGDIYATREPGEAFHERIRACLDLHDESVKVSQDKLIFATTVH